MNYIMQNDFDNVGNYLNINLKIRNGACFEFMGCLIKYYQKGEKYLLIWTDGTSNSKEEARRKINITAKVLTFLMASPIYDSENNIQEVPYFINKNICLGKIGMNKLDKVEKGICKLKVTKVLFYEILDLIAIAYGNLFNDRSEDALIYFFKVIERLAKSYHSLYMQKHHTKGYTGKNKAVLKEILKKYGEDNLGVILTDNMLNTKVDIVYKNLKNEFYGSIFGKISLMLKMSKRYNINIDINNVSKLVKTRNKIAHGDMIDDKELQKDLVHCENVALNMISVYFFHCNYEKLHLKTKRFNE